MRREEDLNKGCFFGLNGSPCPLPVASLPFGDLAKQAYDYWVDACQRSILFLDVLRQRGNMHHQHNSQEVPHVLHFPFEVLLEGKDMPQPVNFTLVRILPVEGSKTDPNKRPFIIFDPRAGHGPGIGGMKKDSEMGVAIQAGHPCYFVTFSPEPLPGQTIEDVCRAEAAFVRKVIELHPHAEKPCLIGNCQAGWQIVLMSAIQPELPGVLILAGAPLSYWAGVRGENMMRYSGGLLGGSWMTSLACDLGNGTFDGAALIENFESMNPSNTLWKKNYNVYSKVDTEAQRFLDFERWWGSPILLNRDEIKFIVDQLFIGNRLSTAKIYTSSGYRMDIRNIKSPIVVFCSKADDITPPQQALGWIPDLYSCDDEIVANGQTIIYALHQNIGHLGIFVSSSVASKEHDKFIHSIDLIETLPPGLYEAVFISKEAGTANPELASGDYVLRFERRSIDDIRRIGVNDEEDERRFATVSRISENLEGMYETFVSPVIRSMVNEQTAELRRKTNHTRMRFEYFSDKNPLMQGIAKLADTVRQNRKPVKHENLFWAMQENMSRQIVAALDAYKDMRDNMKETVFLNIYGSPLLQASVGLRSDRYFSRLTPGRDIERERSVNQRLLDLLAQVDVGGIAEAMVRAIIYVGRGSGALDEREFRLLDKIRTQSSILPSMTYDEYKALVRKQYMMMTLDEESALNAIPTLMDSARGMEKEALSVIRRVVEAHGLLTLEEEKRLKKLEELFVPAHIEYKRRSTDVTETE